MFEEKNSPTSHLSTDQSSLKEHTPNSLLDSIPRVYFLPFPVNDLFVSRGDSRLPEEIWPKGFEAQGTHTNVLEHMCGRTKDSSFISASHLKEQAMQFPPAKPGYLFLIELQHDVIDVNEHIKDLRTEALDIIKSEREVLSPS